MQPGSEFGMSSLFRRTANLMLSMWLILVGVTKNQYQHLLVLIEFIVYTACCNVESVPAPPGTNRIHFFAEYVANTCRCNKESVPAGSGTDS